MKAAILLLPALLVPAWGAIVFPPNNTVTVNSCNLPAGPTSVSFTIKSTSGSVNIYALPDRNTFVPYSIYSAVATPSSNNNVTLNINPSFLANGDNKALIGFFSGNSSVFDGFVTIDVLCTPATSITVTPSSMSAQTAQGGGPFNIVLPGAIKSVSPALYSQKNISLLMTPGTPASVSPWLVSGSVPGYAANSGVVPLGGTADLSLGINPTGLAVQSTPYIGLLHIRDTTNVNQGSADLTVQLAITAPTTGNAVLPHFAANNVYVTDFSIVNTSAQPANYSISFLDDQGNPFSMLVQGKGVVSSISGTVAGNGSAVFSAGDPNAQAVSGGSARITADSSIGVQAAFRLRVQDGTGSHYYEASVPATTGSSEFLIPFDLTKFAPTGEQIYTGIAIANLDTARAANVSCSATDSNGNPIANAVTVPPIGASGHWAGFNFPALTGLRGSLDCTSTTVIGAIALHAFATSGAISTLPVFLK